MSIFSLQAPSRTEIKIKSSWAYLQDCNFPLTESIYEVRPDGQQRGEKEATFTEERFTGRIGGNVSAGDGEETPRSEFLKQGSPET